MKKLAGLTLMLGLAGRVLAGCSDQGVHVIEQQEGDAVRLIAESDHLLDFTVTLTASLYNLKPSRPLPVTVDAKGQRAVELTVLKVADPHLAHYYQYQIQWRCGNRGGIQNEQAVYLLPYSPKEQHTLIQGYFGKFSHYSGSGNEYAYDFAMPVGTTVCAARDGVVVGVRDDSDAGGPYPTFSNCANYVIIRHSDGTYAEYLHLKTKGVLVKLGVAVQAGQPIALSGNTGFSGQPHLHFCVFRLIDATRRETLPTSIQTKKGLLKRLNEREEY